MLDRRNFLIRSVCAGASLTLLPNLSWAADGKGAQRPLLVVLMLRGGVDGLHLAPPLGDPDYARIRGAAAVDSNTLKLDDTFALHPLLPGLHGLYRSGEFALVHAAATPYRERSHFDAQDLLENGSTRPHGLADGWLNRALAATPGGARGDRGVGIGPTIPLLLRGPARVANWSPSTLPQPDADFLARVAALYREGDPVRQALQSGSGRAGMDAASGDAGPAQLAGVAGRFLREPDGPSAAVLEFDGWDSHSAQFSANGQISRNLRRLDATVLALKQSLGDGWRRTVVLGVTEFGRTVAPNGSRGTDHGTATCALLAGGALRGGRVIAQWPGLKPGELLEGRDLRPTTDLRSVTKGLLIGHLGVGESEVETRVFPDSRGAKPLEGLTRT